jgi:uncharacterized heparinase superfamily protein
MTLPDLSRLRQVNAAELTWRARAAADTTVRRVLATINAPAWNRNDFVRILASAPDLVEIRDAASAGRWQDAHLALAVHLQAQQPQRFVIAPRQRDSVVRQITEHCSTAAHDARQRADRLLAGSYDILGYTDLQFDGNRWHHDPVHGRSAPLRFWSTVPYLHHDCGDHKVIWEFNRQQHWLQLGRAYWLTGDDRYRNECLRQLQTWMKANPPLMGINWASMLELGFRTLSWVWALNFFGGDADRDDSPWLVDLLLGLDRQLNHVERHLSYYFSPNTHLLGEALALYVCGRTLPLLRASTRRTDVGRRVLLEEIGRQINADGGHCERSPHYHRYTLDFYLLALAVARITDDPAATTFERVCVRLAQTARLLADERGTLPLIGDDDGGRLLPIGASRPDDIRDSLAVAAALTGHVDLLIDAPHEAVAWMAGHERFADARQRIERAPRTVPIGSAALPATGYYISRSEQGDHIVIDGGEHGYLNGGHAHADALSLTFTHRGRPLLIDTGTGVYSIDTVTRDRFRSTVAHNTLMLNGRSQSTPKGPFHWVDTADATTRRWRTHRHFDYFAGTHDGYTPLAHHRHVFVLHDDILVVADCVSDSAAAPQAPGSPKPAAAVHWHLHPSWSAVLAGTAAVLSRGDGEPVSLHVAGGRLETFKGDVATQLGWFAPAYGRIEPTTTLRLAAEGAAPMWVVSVFGLDAANPVTGVQLQSLASDAPRLDRSTVVTIERDHSVDCLCIADADDHAVPIRWRANHFESDAAVMFTRERDADLVTLALVDGQTLRSERYPYADLSLPVRASVVFTDLSAERDKRKAS